jgi:hypothetical protein
MRHDKTPVLEMKAKNFKAKNFKAKNLKTKNFIVTCRPDTAGRAATPACALHSRLPFADAKKTGIAGEQSPADLTGK